jgi:putative aldouronate transport system permease protein
MGVRHVRSSLRTNAVSRPVDALLNMLFVVYALACILPVGLIAAVSFTHEGALLKDGYRFVPRVWSLEAYRFLFRDTAMLIRSYSITVFVTAAGTALNVLINSMYAYSLSRRDFPFRGFFSGVILVTLLFNGGVPTFYYVYVRFLHLKDSLIALILPGLGAGFTIFIMRTYFRQNVPFEIIESAMMDGAKEVRIFFSLILPVSLPILATAALFSALFYWNDFFNSMLFIENNKLANLQYTMQKAIMNLEFLKRQIGLLSPSAASNISRSVSSQIPSETIRMAMVILGIGPLVLLYPFLQRYFISGLTIGAIKS